MKFCILSDIHGNAIALRECLKYLEKEKIDAFIWCGDFVTDFPESHEVIQLIKQCSNKYKSYIVKGNREDKILDYINGKEFNIRQKRNLEYTSKYLTEEDIKWIETLPEYVEIEVENKKINVSHECSYKEKYMCNYKIFGHTHIMCEFDEKNVKYVNPGSVGITADGKVGAEFIIMEITKDSEQIQQILIQYEMDSVLQKIKDTPIYNDDIKWGKLIEKELITGIDYPEKYFQEYEKLLKEKDEKDESIELWNMAVEKVLGNAPKR